MTIEDIFSTTRRSGEGLQFLEKQFEKFCYGAQEVVTSRQHAEIPMDFSTDLENRSFTVAYCAREMCIEWIPGLDSDSNLIGRLLFSESSFTGQGRKYFRQVIFSAGGSCDAKIEGASLRLNSDLHSALLLLETFNQMMAIDPLADL